MKIPGNAWAEAWTNAKPVPAHRQKRLFDDTREAEKVLQFLTGLKPGEATQLLLPVALNAGVHRILEEDNFEQVPMLRDIMGEVIKMLARMSKLQCRWVAVLSKELIFFHFLPNFFKLLIFFQAV